MAKIASKRILERLQKRASESPRPNQRFGTIDRVVAACDAIESGDAAKTIKEVFGKDFNLRHNPEINPTSVARYIEARQKKGGNGWTGPKRPTIQSNYDLKTYVEAREAERIKPSKAQNKTSHRDELMNAIDRIPRLVDRVLVRDHLAKLQSAKRENDALAELLKKIPPLLYDKLRNGEMSQNDNLKVEGSSVKEALLDKNVVVIKRLIDRLNDEQVLSSFGLEIFRGRVRHKKKGRVLIEKDELSCLSLVAGQHTDI